MEILSHAGHGYLKSVKSRATGLGRYPENFGSYPQDTSLVLTVRKIPGFDLCEVVIKITNTCWPP